MTNLSLSLFYEQIKRLLDCYGHKFFHKERQDLIWETVKPLQDEEFVRIVDSLIKTKRSAPLPADFEKATKKILQVKYYERRSDGDVITRSEHEHKPHCAFCCDTGILEAQIIGETNAIHFKCDCEAESTWDLPAWGDKWINDFTRLPMWPDRSKKWIPTMERSFAQIEDEWKARIEISQDYWKWRNDESN